MSYSQYKEEIVALVAKNSNERLNEFATKILQKTLKYVKAMNWAGLQPEEVPVIQKLVALVESQQIDWPQMGLLLDQLTEISESSSDDAEEMPLEFLEFLVALDNWRAFEETGDKEAIAFVAENLMNLLDHYYVGDVSLDDWLMVPQIREEYLAQVQFLSNSN